MKGRLLSAFAVGIVISGYAAGLHAEVFSNPTAGFEMTKPDDWTYMTAEQNLENLKGVKLSDAEFQSAMQKYSTAPLVVIAKHKEPFNDLNPSFKVNIKAYGQLKGTNLQALIAMLIPQFERMFKGFQLTQAPKEVLVSGIPSAYARMNYNLETPDGASYPTTSELWIVPRGDYFFMLGAGTRQDEKTGSRKEIESILRSVKIRR